jgi:hypothetical protein
MLEQVKTDLPSIGSCPNRVFASQQAAMAHVTSKNIADKATVAKH